MNHCLVPFKSLRVMLVSVVSSKMWISLQFYSLSTVCVCVRARVCVPARTCVAKASLGDPKDSTLLLFSC